MGKGDDFGEDLDLSKLSDAEQALHKKIWEDFTKLGYEQYNPLEDHNVSFDNAWDDYCALHRDTPLTAMSMACVEYNTSWQNAREHYYKWGVEIFLFYHVADHRNITSLVDNMNKYPRECFEAGIYAAKSGITPTELEILTSLRKMIVELSRNDENDMLIDGIGRAMEAIREHIAIRVLNNIK